MASPLNSPAALALGALLALAPAASPTFADDGRAPRHESRIALSPNAQGLAATLSTGGPIDRSNPFFQSLGSNGRSCASCHVQSEGWTVTPSGLRRRFRESNGFDPVFRLVDGAVSPRADVSTSAARREAYRVLLDKGLIRVGIGIPPDAEFELAAVDDPYGYASATELSLFRRPLPSTNVRFLSTVMWDGRETLPDPSSGDCLFGTTTCFAPVHTDLMHQSNDATLGHAQASMPLSELQQVRIADVEQSLCTAQVFDRRAGWLDREGARGGPAYLATLAPYFGINDTLIGDYRTHAGFNPEAMTLYCAWDRAWAPPGRHEDDEHGSVQARRAIARGQALFNGRGFTITGVKGLNDALGVAALPGTCTTCHNSPQAGNHSIPLPLDIGIADASRRTPDLPLYTLRRKASGELTQTTDPGRALITGRWADIGRFKGPTLRGLAARPPYFHNGSAASLREVVDFYDQRFRIGLSEQDKEDLVAFLNAL
ncbi:MAG TPA: cytochrome C [Albitalea sp.]|nr:cytochrome C [Albitalea sp.]